jgi:Arc/MetJ-type ribon-helix-helix transcriptional regulator
MSTDTDDGRDGDGSEMTKIDVRVPKQLVEQIDEKYAERGYTSRSGAIRDALRAWVDPPVRLSDEILEDLATSRRQREQGETKPLSEVAEKYGVDVDGDTS